MSEFWRDPNFWLNVFIAVLVGTGALVGLYRWTQHRKAPALDAYFILNPNQPNESRTKIMNVPASQIFIYFALDVNDKRKYSKPYAIVKFPQEITIRYGFPYTKYWCGSQPRAIKSNEAGFFNYDITLKEGQIRSLVFPLLVDFQQKKGSFPVTVELGAENIDASAVLVKLMINVVNDNYSHDITYFQFDTYEITQ